MKKYLRAASEPQINPSDVKGITLLSVDEAETVPEDIRKASYTWWTRTPGDEDSRVFAVWAGGLVESDDSYVGVDLGVRPALIVPNLSSYNLPDYSKVSLFGKDWYVLNNLNYLFANDVLDDIPFDDNKNNNYETSYIKKWVERWLKNPTMVTKREKYLQERLRKEAHDAAMNLVWEEFEIAQKSFINNSIKNFEDYKNAVKQTEEYEYLEDYLDGCDENLVLQELYKMVAKKRSKKPKLTTHIDIVDNGEEVPYLSGWCDEDIDITDRSDLSESELWSTGWIGAVQNPENAPFNSFDEIDIYCYDLEKNNEYDLPNIPDGTKKEFLRKVNKWIQENPDEY